jgi:hypothetical protein
MRASMASNARPLSKHTITIRKANDPRCPHYHSYRCAVPGNRGGARLDHPRSSGLNLHKYGLPIPSARPTREAAMRSPRAGGGSKRKPRFRTYHQHR